MFIAFSDAVNRDCMFASNWRKAKRVVAGTATCLINIMGLSIRAYARHRGVSHVAVKKAIDSGRITAEADGTIEPNRADLDWSRNTITPRKSADQDGDAVVHEEAIEPRRAAEPARHETPKKQPERQPERQPKKEAPLSEQALQPVTAGGTSLLHARTVNEVLKAQNQRLELARKKGELVDRSSVVSHIFARAREERDAWLNWPSRISSQMAAKLDVDAHELHIALENAVRDHLIELGEFKSPIQ